MEALRSSKSVDAPARQGYFHPGRGHKLVRVAFILALVLPCPCLSQVASPAHKADPQGLEGKRVEVRIIARGPSIISSTGNMDIYLAVISGGRRVEPVAARLMHYYPFFASGLSDEWMASGHPFRLRLSYAAYCSVGIKSFVVHQIFDQDALSKARDIDSRAALPCYLVRD